MYQSSDSSKRRYMSVPKRNIESLPAETPVADMRTCGKFYVVKNFNPEGKLIRIEIHAGKLKSGACGITLMQAIQDLINSKLKYGASAENIARKYLIGNICINDCSHVEGGFHSCVDAVGHLLLSSE